MAEQGIGAGQVGLSFEEFAPQCETRFLAAANQIRDGLIAAGLAANRVTVSEPNTTDLRVQIQATGAGNRSLLAYLELTDSLHLGQTVPGQAIITVYLEGNGAPIATQYIAGNVQPYTDPAGIDSLLTKLGEAEAAIPDLITKARAFLRL